MQENDVAGIIRSRTEGDQKKEGTFHIHFSRLKEEFARLYNAGGGSEEVRDAMFALLHAFENERLSHEKAIRKAERQIDYCRAMQRSCSLHANLLVDVLARKAGDWEKREPVEPSSGNGRLADGTAIMTEDEARARLCVCACVDEEDAEECACTCHEGIPCEDERCVVCAAKRAAGLPTKVSKKKRTKKKSTKKAVKEGKV